MSDQYPTYPGAEPPQQPAGQQPTPQQSPGMPGPMPGGEAQAPPGYGPPVPSKRPGSVTAASVISIILSSLTVLSGIALAVASGPINDYLRDNPDELQGINPSDQQDVLDVIEGALVGAAAFTVLIGVIGVVLGVLVLKPRQWARVMLAVGAGVTILVGLLMSLNLVGLPWLVGAIAVMVLLFQGRASDWFAGRPQRH